MGSDDGSGKSTSGVFPIAERMKRFQMIVGNVPPATWIPWTFSIGTCPCGYPIQTVVLRFGV